MIDILKKNLDVKHIEKMVCCNALYFKLLQRRG